MSTESPMPAAKLNAKWLASLPQEKRQAFLDGLSDEEHAALLFDWSFWARGEQLPPPGDWTTWAIIAGRGAGKTRSGAEWIRGEVAAERASRIALVAQDAADARDVMVEGPSGLLAVSPPWNRPIYEPSKRRLTWANGARATLYSAEDPESLRGPNFDAAWVDELGKWRYGQETWDQLQFGLRLGLRPRQVVTTTPRPIKLLREIMARKDTVVTHGTTYDNRANLAPAFFKEIVRRYEGTRLGRQELRAEMLDEVPGALWTRAGLDQGRKKPDQIPDLVRVVVAIDPAIKEPGEDIELEGSAETGIVAAGLGVDGHGYVLGDLSCRLGPNGWARRACAGLDEFDADAIVAETNQGGAMVKATIRAVRPHVKVIEVNASRGKTTRAEPVAALYEQQRVRHVGTFPELEDQMMLFTPFGIEGDTTADRADALVWALTQLFPGMIRAAKKKKLVTSEGVRGFDAHRF